MKQKTKPENWAMTALGRERRAHLTSRIAMVNRARYGFEPSDTPAVAKARGIIDAHEKRQGEKAEQLRKEVQIAVKEAEKAVLFADSAEGAHAAVLRLETLAKAKKWRVEV